MFQGVSKEISGMKWVKVNEKQVNKKKKIFLKNHMDKHKKTYLITLFRIISYIFQAVQ